MEDATTMTITTTITTMLRQRCDDDADNAADQTAKDDTDTDDADSNNPSAAPCCTQIGAPLPFSAHRFCPVSLPCVLAPDRREESSNIDIKPTWQPPYRKVRSEYMGPFLSPLPGFKSRNRQHENRHASVKRETFGVKREPQAYGSETTDQTATYKVKTWGLDGTELQKKGEHRT